MDRSLRALPGAQVAETEVGEEPRRFEDFFGSEHARLFGALCLVTGDRNEAEEIMQDAFLAVWERWDRVGSMEDPTGYLYRTAMNVLRKRHRRAVLFARKVFTMTPAPEPFSEIDEQQDLVAALADLTPRQRAALVLLDVLDYSSEEAGRALGVKPGTVRGLASRAREALRAQADDRA